MGGTWLIASAQHSASLWLAICGFEGDTRHLLLEKLMRKKSLFFPLHKCACDCLGHPMLMGSQTPQAKEQKGWEVGDLTARTAPREVRAEC